MKESTLKITQNSSLDKNILLLPKSIKKIYKLLNVKQKKQQDELRKQWRAFWSTNFHVRLTNKSDWLHALFFFDEWDFDVFEPVTDFHDNGMPRSVVISRQFTHQLWLHYTVFSSKITNVSNIDPVLWDLIVWCSGRSYRRPRVRVGWKQLKDQFLSHAKRYNKKSNACCRLSEYFQYLRQIGLLVGFKEHNGSFNLTFESNVTSIGLKKKVTSVDQKGHFCGPDDTQKQHLICC